ncbi:4301_t:CDS:2 [Gigaspora margarita]|uniref:4301_t:CDS:1 n=1 Tax=Gigaspora margarita TaxID=4874 RepID=A0ABN7UU79_GIGMA|nr:4301_t:CDS:2 [Gigaspora margarita]
MSKNLYMEILSHDFKKLFEEGSNYDVEIKVGEEPNIKIFRGHSQIFIARSSYFKSAFSQEWVKKKDGIINFEKPNILPEIFELIIRYIYTGIIQYDILQADHIREIKKEIYSKKYTRSFPTKDPYVIDLLQPIQYGAPPCVNPTITVFRITELDLIIGGYNPFKTKYSKILYPPSFKMKAEYSFMFKIANKKIEFISTLGTQDFDLDYNNITPLNIFDFKFHNVREISYKQHFYRKLLDGNTNNYNIEGLQVFKVIQIFE